MDSRTTGVIGGAGRGAAIGNQILPGWGTAIGAVAGGLLGGALGGGEDEAEKLAEMQAREIDRAQEENRRRTMLEMGQVLGTSRAAIGASNIQFDGSAKRYSEAIASEYRKRMAWDRQKAKVQKEMALAGGQMAADQISMAGLQGAFTGLSKAADAGVFGTFKGGAYKAPWVA
jgi:hypothetical protein